jgi:hypothetical protein
MAQETNLKVFRGQALSVDLSPATPTNVEAWTCRFRVRTQTGQTVIEKHTGSGVTVLDPVRGDMVVPLNAQETSLLSLPAYKWDFWRIDPGSEDPLAYGLMNMGDT